MKLFKKMMALALAMVMVLAMGVTVFAAPVEGTKLTYDGADKTTDGKISLTNATKDTTYTLYKIFDATFDGDNVAYTTKNKDLGLDPEYFTIATEADANGNYAVTRTMDGENPKKDNAALLDYLKGLNKSLFTEIGSIKSTTDGTIEWEKIPYGYYLISPDKPATGAAVTIDSNTPTVNVIDKNQTPEFEKNIKDGEELVKWNEAGLAIDVPFDITVKAKNYDGDYKVYEYTIKDTLDPGFTFKNDLKVKVGDADKTADSLTTIKYYTDSSKATETTYDKATYFEIVVKWTQDGDKGKDHLYPANETINVTYTAFLDPAKADQVKVGKTANENTADVTYKKFKGDDDVEGDLPDQKTKTFETKLTITKTDGSNALAGAEFTLETTDGTKVSYTSGEVYVPATDGTYYLLNDGTYTDTAPTTATASQYASETQKYKKESVASTGNGQTVSTMKAFVGSDGKLTFSGLGIGTYTLKETVVPKGYNKADDIEFTITAETDDTDPNNVIVKFASNNEKIVLDDTNNVFTTTIVNNKGTELPSTGGIGTTIFYVIGAILVLGAGILLVTRRRMNAN